MKHTITLIPGDGIGPEVTEAAVRVVEAAGVECEWERMEAGAEVVAKYGTPVPDEVIHSILKNRVALKGPITTPVGVGFPSANVTLRKRLNLYANVRPARTIPGVPSRYDHVDLVIIRENSEDLYSGLEHIVVPGVVESLKIITEAASLRIGRYAFEYAKSHGRRKVTAVHKANIMKLADGLFLECLRRISREFPEIEYEEMIVDATCMNMVMRPERFDVMVMENLYGDILSDLASGLIGGLGFAGSANIGEGGIALFEAVHGSAPDIAGRHIANPIALILSAVMMLRHLGEQAAANRIENAVMKVMAEGKVRTRDMGGDATTDQITDAIIAAL
ncbi:NAD-dependent isocitrate dehydrogenase [Chthonomonas calidirosea]|uniref:Isocitrate dehydrogenase, NAD-dependent,mitochondrial type n=1 Tax=Chthonomonas calidirosea (strain DSM 23976 / ICMP 18418 / T49) TaxID=1303518 RepID=S0EW25_CHTCT|nr:isocitrate dehydrogenase (NAD(+)) [Chthonomonas calidirosea]CCW34597.1 isocitrate dehydrogenase, NAD-dependent,mitochondrial type [Chthonomonas calidirosea T49]CEK13132.1 NAD-dependent isocitrate dehydrogenase [Chthonomonas calidirosea]CEK14328.1 NAD-dependent isocitrate dehydrogenase [Chthonomonas calidirosea]